jgi:hypothetical protein
MTLAQPDPDRLDHPLRQDRLFLREIQQPRRRSVVIVAPYHYCPTLTDAEQESSY